MAGVPESELLTEARSQSRSDAHWTLTVFLIVSNVTLMSMVGSIAVGGSGLEEPWDGPTVVTVVLTALAVMLTILAIGMATLGFFGYTVIRRNAVEMACREAVREVRKIVPPIAAREARAAASADGTTMDDVASTQFMNAMKEGNG